MYLKYLLRTISVLLTIVVLIIVTSARPVHAADSCTVLIQGDLHVGSSSSLIITVKSDQSLNGYYFVMPYGEKTAISGFNGQKTFTFQNGFVEPTNVQFSVEDASGTTVCTATARIIEKPTTDTDLVDPKFLLQVNPLTIMGNNNPIEDIVQGGGNILVFSTPAGFVSMLLIFLFPLAGMILFIMIVWGGFEMMWGATDTKAQEAGRQRITAALIGFTLLFCTYWIAQILEVVFGVNILG